MNRQGFDEAINQVVGQDGPWSDNAVEKLWDAISAPVASGVDLSGVKHIPGATCKKHPFVHYKTRDGGGGYTVQYCPKCDDENNPFATLPPQPVGPVADTDWNVKRRQVGEMVKQLQSKPESERMGYAVCPGGFLNAYREGDLSFSDAVAAIEKWASEQKPVAGQVHGVGFGLDICCACGLSKKDHIGEYHKCKNGEATYVPRPMHEEKMAMIYERCVKALASGNEDVMALTDICNIIEHEGIRHPQPKAVS